MSLGIILACAIATGPGLGQDDTIAIPLAPCAIELDSTGGNLLDVLTGAKRKQVAFRGQLEVDGTAYALYVPRADAYTIVNSGASDDHHGNKSTAIAIDADADGDLARAEYWFSNLPVRIGDRMFTIRAIEPEGRGLVLAPSSEPLRGVVVGRKCPPFSFRTQDGRTVSLADYRDKILILDIWSFT